MPALTLLPNLITRCRGATGRGDIDRRPRVASRGPAMRWHDLFLVFLIGDGEQTLEARSSQFFRPVMSPTPTFPLLPTERRALPVLTPPKDSRSFSLPPPTLDLFFPFQLALRIEVRKRWEAGTAKRTRTRIGEADPWLGLDNEDFGYCSCVRRPFPFPTVPSPSLARKSPLADHKFARKLVTYAATSNTVGLHTAVHTGRCPGQRGAGFADLKHVDETLFDASPCGVEETSVARTPPRVPSHFLPVVARRSIENIVLFYIPLDEATLEIPHRRSASELGCARIELGLIGDTEYSERKPTRTEFQTAQKPLAPFRINCSGPKSIAWARKRIEVWGESDWFRDASWYHTTGCQQKGRKGLIAA
ncbi:hypothetical protein K438DRAFT_1783869 [Mycena galopus ATCC 62051]|nr:hypothetical protein K438DRAFT_1783869 [Mycena galopus ATCC 62051]